MRAPNRLDKALAALVPEDAALSRSRLMKMIDEGDVLLEGVAVTNPKAKVAEGQVYALRLAPAVEVETLGRRRFALTGGMGGRRPDRHRQAGWHGGASRSRHAIGHAWSTRFWPIAATRCRASEVMRRPGIVHRIDKDTTGLLVVAKSDRAHHGLAAQFEAHSVNRHYLAVVHGAPSAHDPRLRGLRGISFEGRRHPEDRHRPCASQDRPAASGRGLGSGPACGDARPGG
jgi:23S rRNA pseudouridine1911/1915/1917 synthase